MRNFDIKRFGRLMQWTMINDRSVFVRLTITWIIMFFMLFLMAIYLVGPNVGYTAYPYSSHLDNGLGMATGVMVCALLFEPCFIFSNLKKNQERINFFMLPSTNLEKFIARFISVIVIWTLCCLIGFVAADVLQWLVAVILHPQATGFVMSQIDFFSLLPPFFMFGIRVDVSHFWLFLTFILSVLSLHSFYLLGGTFFRRHTWALTVLTSILLSIVLGWLVSYMKVYVGHVDLNVVLCVISTVDVLVIVFSYWASFRLFKHMQIINNKCINL